MSLTLPDDDLSSNPEKAPKLTIVQGDFLAQTGVAARVFFMPEDLSWQGHLNHAILEEAGPALDSYILDAVIRPRRGDAFYVPADVGGWKYAYFLGILPKWDGGMDDEERVLKKAIRGILDLAEEEEVPSLAFPALGMGNKDYPVRRAARLVLSILTAFPYKALKDVRVVCKTPEIFEAYTSG